MAQIYYNGLVGICQHMESGWYDKKEGAYGTPSSAISGGEYE